jgi:hypothetical protein
MELSTSDLPTELQHIPSDWLSTPYVYARDPTNATFDDPKKGANCQLFAYAVLRQCGLYVPPLRSSDLWEETEFTEVVTEPEQLDLVLVNNSPDSYGAHIGLMASSTQVLHLSKQVDRPALWTLDELQQHDRYRFLIGFKRCLRTVEEADRPFTLS